MGKKHSSRKAEPRETKVTEVDFDKWQDLYSKRTECIQCSEVRELFRYASRPDIISMAGGNPYTKSFPMEKIIETTRFIMETDGPAALQYTVSEGIEGLRKCVATVMADEGVKVDPEDVLIVDGAQQALDLLGKIFIDEGSPILVEGPSYVGALNAFYAYEPKVIAVKMDDDGLQIDLLETALRKLEKEKTRPRFLYTVPNFHNPAGITLSKKRRPELLRVAREHDLLVIEDNAYGRLRFEGENLPLLRSLDDEVVHLGTFSKIFTPGFRIGWVIGPRPILDKLSYAKQAADLCSSSFAQRLIEQYFARNLWTEHVASLIETYRRRRDVMLAALKEFFPEEASWTYPQGGFFVWVTLPEYIDTREMLARAISQKVVYISGGGFFADGTGANCMRLNFSYPEESDIYEGIKRLSKVVKEQMALYKSVAVKLKL